MKKITSILFWIGCVLLSFQANAQLFSENFETGLGQFANEAGNTVDWQIDTGLFQDGTQSVLNAYGSNSNNILYQTNPIDLSAANNPQLSFWHIAKLEGGYDEAIVEISTDGGATFTPFTDIDYLGSGITVSAGTFNEDAYGQWGTGSETPANAWWKREFFDLSAYNTATVVVRFRLTSDGSVQREGWYLDNVEILEITCPKPSEIVIDQITANAADISWTSGGSETEWEILYGPAGFNPETEGNAVQDTDGTIGETITGLNPATDYDVYVRAICGAGNES
ncbi:fibronectin type III domain-containing protein, partial [Haloflavibacter putidus]